MAFANISTELQAIYLQDFSNIAKWSVFLIFIALSCLYIFYIWKKQKKTISVMKAVFRGIFYVLSITCLLTSPYLLMLMSPEYSFWQFFILPLTLYSIFFVLFLVMCGVDLIRYGVPLLLHYGNVDMQDSNVNDLMNKIENNKHFLK